MKRTILVTLLLALAVPASAQTTLDIDNVGNLKLAWTYDTGDSTQSVGLTGKPPIFSATPAYHDGRLYLSTPHGTVAAVDAETGVEVWKTTLAVKRSANYSDPANRGPTIHRDRLYVGTIDGRLVCLNIGNGSRCEKFGNHGDIDLIAGLRSKPGYAGEYGVTSAPAVYRNLVIVGSSVGDNSRARMSSGEVRAFDATTGELKWTFHPLSEAVATGAANTWSKIVVDEERDLAFLPTGSPSPDYFGGLRPGNNEYANSVVVLKASTGEVVWHFQTVHHDLWDYDVASPPLLYTAESKGTSIPAVAIGSKTGHLFLFDRTNGKPLFPIEERKVPASDVQGEAPSHTQPFPTKPASLVPQQVTEAGIWGPTSADRAACLELFRSLRNEGVFTPPSGRGALHVPGNIGGLHWGGIAWDAKSRLLIAPVNRLPAIIRLIPRDDFSAARKEFPSRETTEQDGTPYAMSREFFRSPSGLPCTAPPWGELVAVRADDGEIAWRVPLGEVPAKVFGAQASIAGSMNLGGPATANGLVFIGASLDARLRAFDASTGREVWKGALPTSARATPLVFANKNGQAMVVIAAGGHDAPNVKLDTKLVAFALPRGQ